MRPLSVSVLRTSPPLPLNEGEDRCQRSPLILSLTKWGRGVREADGEGASRGIATHDFHPRLPIFSAASLSAKLLKSLSPELSKEPQGKIAALFSKRIAPLFSTPNSVWAILAPSLLAGTRVMNRSSGRAAVPGWWQDGTLLGDEPPSPGLDGDQGQRPRPPPGQEHRRGAEAAPRIKIREARPCAPLPDFSFRGKERSLKQPDCESRAWQR